ncbi:uncharacterized protein BDZ99DRAFT_419220 [Mytilinidion resinicola]|uniref:Nucleotide-diphospho-sugar transferase domain-containing protein n=1 Tax=Mytilinidion resinicola TaxID=574789 RepID=A0A6A6YJX9_9PEZI|nr:uncharacterized protein BDZ99DRAFT_419220 [Mytilinidion resinicola]KAF2808265.1 hypothetical protein BDZ99DRAFT_419220 [Mytilinidion resinicola]
MHDGEFVWSDTDRYSAGMMNHYTYATLHGYDYKFVNAANYTDRSPTWIKPAAIANLLPSYKFVIFLDADATFNTMHIPLEWLFNYWNITAKVSIAMALDPNATSNYDRFQRLLTNTGFMIVQYNAVTMHMLRAWDECPGETRYAGCAEWKHPRFHEQSAFGNYVRYDYGEWIKELPCNEANGEPEFGECKGVFVSHFWWRTDNVKKYFEMNALQALMGRVQGEMVDRKKEVVKLQMENVIAHG